MVHQTNFQNYYLVPFDEGNWYLVWQDQDGNQIGDLLPNTPDTTEEVAQRHLEDALQCSFS